MMLSRLVRRLSSLRFARLVATMAAGSTAAVLAAGTGVAGAQSNSFVVEDWAKATVGQQGIPPGWQGQKWGSPRYDFTVIQDGAGRALMVKSDNDSSTISKEIKVDTKQYPVIQWRWKVVEIPPRGDARKSETDDEAAQLYVTFPRFPTAVRSRIIGYVWDSNAPAGSTFPSAKVNTITFVVVRSGSADVGKWVTETRNVHQDYKRIYGDDPGETVGAVSISVNSQNTRSRAEAIFGDILFKKP